MKLPLQSWVECDTSANHWDSDADGLCDMCEVLSEVDYGTNPIIADTDADLLTDMLEFELGTLPDEKDTDDDGLSDLDEIIAGTDQNDPCDPNHDCVACLAIRTPARTPAATPSSTPVVTSAPEPTPVGAPEWTPAATPKPRIPGFEVELLLIAFAVVIGYLWRVKRRKL